MDLIIVESPTKARTLTKFLKNKVKVEASIGHIRDLPKSELGVDVSANFQPKYVIPTDKKKRVSELKALAAKADRVILATDPDREGEAIAWHIAEILNKSQSPSSNSQKKTKKNKNEENAKQSFDRIVFHEITESAILEAMSHPRAIDMRLVDSQQARRILDRLVGYKLSPLLWKKLSRRWLSAGRVQSVATRLVVEREREVLAFDKADYFTIVGAFEKTGGSTLKKDEISAQLVAKDKVKFEQTQTHTLFDGTYTVTKTSISTQEQAQAIIADLALPFTVSAVDKREVKRQPQAPYTTSTLQQDAGRKLSFSSKKTMQTAQRLYEEGFITYHRTDSVNLSEKFISEAREFIKNTHGADYLPENPRLFTTKSKVAQEAHEAIRPTNVAVHGTTLEGKGELNRDHARLYDLIWRRAVASQARDAKFDSTTIRITTKNEYEFEAKGSVIVFEGYLVIAGRESEDVIFPAIAVGDLVTPRDIKIELHTTNPPPRYSEASLVKTLEEKDIGRPSTYASIISTIIDRQYVTKEEKKLVATELGSSVTDFLVQYFKDILNLPFTANMEGLLDKIANGESEWQPVIAEFYKTFEKDLENSYDLAEKVKLAEEEYDGACPDCGGKLVIKTGRYGKFIACTNFPTCKYTKQFLEKIDVICPRCRADIVVKKTRKGKMFYGCSNYPSCTFAAWKKEDIK